jgi:nitrite reductase/ring-hydroxylating ferredoxin subunit
MKIHNVEQGSPEWHALRCGVITASNMKLLMTPTLKPANNDKSRSHLYELAAQRISRYMEPQYISSDMLRGHEDEVRARIKYEEHTGSAVQEVGFVTNEICGHIIGCSPDGVVASDGMIECKSRCQKYQVQTGLLVTDCAWCDFISYSGGLPMIIIRVYPDARIQEAIRSTVAEAEAKIAHMVLNFNMMSELHGWPVTERATEDEDGGYKWEVEAD